MSQQSAIKSFSEALKRKEFFKVISMAKSLRRFEIKEAFIGRLRRAHFYSLRPSQDSVSKFYRWIDERSPYSDPPMLVLLVCAVFMYTAKNKLMYEKLIMEILETQSIQSSQSGRIIDMFVKANVKGPALLDALHKAILISRADDANFNDTFLQEVMSDAILWNRVQIFEYCMNQKQYAFTMEAFAYSVLIDRYQIAIMMLHKERSDIEENVRWIANILSGYDKVKDQELHLAYRYFLGYYKRQVAGHVQTKKL